MYNNQKKRDFTPINNQIRSSKVVCIDNNDKNLGEIDTSEALKIAYDAGLDLVQVSSGKNRYPTCKVLDYGKYKYQQSKNQKAAAKKQRENTIKTKEIQFRPSTEINDLKVKAEKAKEILNEGDHVRISVLFKGRELSYQDLAKETLNQFLMLIPDINIIERPTMSGKTLSVLIQKKQQT